MLLLRMLRFIFICAVTRLLRRRRYDADAFRCRRC